MLSLPSVTGFTTSSNIKLSLSPHFTMKPPKFIMQHKCVVMTSVREGLSNCEIARIIERSKPYA